MEVYRLKYAGRVGRLLEDSGANQKVAHQYPRKVWIHGGCDIRDFNQSVLPDQSR